MCEAEPEGIVSVEREVLEQKAEGSSSAKASLYTPRLLQRFRASTLSPSVWPLQATPTRPTTA